MVYAGPFYFAMEDSKLKTPILRSMVLSEIQYYHPNINIERAWDAQAAQDARDHAIAERKQAEEEAAKSQAHATITLTADTRAQNIMPDICVTWHWKLRLDCRRI